LQRCQVEIGGGKIFGETKIGTRREEKKAGHIKWKTKKGND